MITVLQETTKWEDNITNGIYHVNDAGHLVQYNDKKFAIPIKGFDKRRRTFDKIREGSKGNTYTIKDGRCSCPGFVYRNDCKHVKELV